MMYTLDTKSFKKSVIRSILFSIFLLSILFAFSTDSFFSVVLNIIAFVLLSLFIYKRINSYDKYIKEIYDKQLEALHKSEKKLLQSKQHFQEIFNVTPNMIITTDGQEIDRANPAMLAFTGHKTLEDFKREHACICELFLEEQEYLTSDVNGQNWLDYILETPSQTHKVLMLKEGKKYSFLVWAKTIELNHNTHSVVSFSDITKQRELELQLKASKKIFDLFMENIPYIVTIKDENYKNIYTNKKEIEYFKQDGLHKNLQEELGEEQADKIEAFLNASKTKKSANKVMKISIENEAFYVRLVTFPIPQANDIVLTALLYIDITKEYANELKIKEQEEIMIAQSRHAAMGEMISMIAHQWRQPISVIAMDANNILADIELEMVDETTLQETSLDIISKTQELSKTIDDFRNFFRPEKVAQEVLLKDIVNEALGIIQASLKNNNIELIFDSSTPYKIKTYARELMQVLINLLNNAKEALVEHKIQRRKITLSIEKKADKYSLNVCDNAGGVDEKIIDKIFDPYFTTKGEKNGTGLGLYMSQTIIDKHLNGTLSVTNKEDGACFEIVLPVSIEGEK